MNIILVSGATARVRSLTLDWRHWTLCGLALAVVSVVFTGVFNFVTLRYAASIQHPWLEAIVLADQRQEAQELPQGHLDAMALRLGELQARIMRLVGLGERLAKVAGQSFHEGIDFPAEVGTPVVAAASGKVIEAGSHPQYGKIVRVVRPVPICTSRFG